MTDKELLAALEQAAWERNDGRFLFKGVLLHVALIALVACFIGFMVAL